MSGAPNAKPPTTTKPLKRLGFVQSGTDFAYCEAEWIYKTIRSFTPQFFTPSLEKVEKNVAAVAAPYVHKAEEVYPQLLQLADDRVDYLFRAADTTISQGKNGVSASLKQVKEMRDANVKYAYENVSAATESYLNFMSSAANFAVEKLNAKGLQEATMKRVEAARDAVQAAVRKARDATTDPDVAVEMAWDAWTSFAAMPPVAKLLETAEPATKLGMQAFYKMHDTLVATPMYKMVLDRTAVTMCYAASTTPYKLGAQYLYPIVQPMADPTIAKVTNSKTIMAACDYWKPAAVAAQ